MNRSRREPAARAPEHRLLQLRTALLGMSHELARVKRENIALRRELAALRVEREPVRQPAL